MSTVDKDFKVKNGLNVTNGGSFGGAVIVGTPTDATHATTKEYVDALAAGTPVGVTPPSSPVDGDLWFDTLTERLNVFYVDMWRTLATIDDTLTIPDHIHDTSIDGNGLIATRFVSAGSFNDPQGTALNGGEPQTTTFESVYSGGIAIDNFN